MSHQGVEGGGYWHSYGQRSDEQTWKLSWTAFLDPTCERGLSVELTSGARKSVLYTFSMKAEDPTYDRNELLMETEWIGALGSMLATWAGRPYRSLL